MLPLTRDLIRHDVADSYLIYKRGLRLYENGAFILQAQDFDAGRFDYQVDGSYGDYITHVDLGGQALSTRCSCPYPGSGCKHTVAVLLYTKDLLEAQEARQAPSAPAEEAFLSPAEIRAQALDDRKSRARSEHFRITAGDMLKGCHLLETESGGQYTVTLHDPDKGVGHCTCPDYLTNRLGTCKHLICLTQHLKRRKDFADRLAQERFPFVDLYWDSADAAPRLYPELPKRQTSALGRALAPCFDDRGAYTGEEAPPEPAPAAQSAEDPARRDGGAHILAAQPPEKIEAVLNTGMLFIGGLLEMATGQKMTATAADGRMVQIDRETGEVTLKFRLPGF